jgi:nitrate reductase assembly molybdenum cofactor insertion protein NarJ
VDTQLTYPVQDMLATAKTIEQLADEQWTQHLDLFLHRSPAFATLTQGIARLLPNAGSQMSSLQEALAQRQQQYQACYAALQVLAHGLELAAATAQTTDQQSVAPGFQSSQSAG